MSADNYYVVRKDAYGFFVPVMGFASSDESGYVPRVESVDKRFVTVKDALDWALNSYSEYGVSVHSECESDEPSVLELSPAGHFWDCDFSDEFVSVYHEFEPVCSCKEVEADWMVRVEPVSAERKSLN